MAFSKSASQPVRKINKIGDMTYSVTIPKDIIRKLQWREGQNVLVTEKNNEVIIKDWEK